MLEVEHIFFSYGDVSVLTDVSMRVDDGEFVVLFGPNGHGKSTLLKTICGLQKADSGLVKYNDVPINKLSVQKVVEMGISCIAEDRHLFLDMSVADNLAMGAFNRNARKDEKKNLEYVFDIFPRLRALRRQTASTLSGGEARMLAIGRGIMANAKFLALDEPSFGLAPNLRVEVFKKIYEIKGKGASVLVVEQSTPIAANYADRIYVLENGRIVFDGTKSEAMASDDIRQVFLGV